MLRGMGGAEAGRRGRTVGMCGAVRRNIYFGFLLALCNLFLIFVGKLINLMAGMTRRCCILRLRGLLLFPVGTWK